MNLSFEKRLKRSFPGKGEGEADLYTHINFSKISPYEAGIANVDIVPESLGS